MQKDQKLEDVLFYLIEKTNKVVRRYAQEKFVAAGLTITVDQWLVLKKVNESNEITQIELADALFKDRASVTRILTLLETKKLIERVGAEDRRANQLTITAAGRKLMEQAMPIVKSSRKKGLEMLSEKEQAGLRNGLQKIIDSLS